VSNFSPANIGALAAGIGALDSRVGALESNVAQLQNSVKRAYEGTAIAIATGGAYLPEGKTYAITANYGTFRGQNAFAASGMVRVADFAYLNGAIGVGFDHGGVGGRGGVTFAW
jgi:X-X-X-Leu-X-X-Gly heptad repeat protein